MKNGIIVLNKPAGMTSHDCVSKVRRLSKMKKVGHTGTLDPAVTGVLPLCLGKATRVAEFLLDYEKEYEAEIVLGRATSTQDRWGEIEEESALLSAPSQAQLEDVLQQFRGPIQQIPPMYSALKVGGKRLHQLAREGKQINREPRKVHIYTLSLLSYSPHPPYPSFKIRVSCSKGTYIRTLGVDIGAALGFPAFLNSLIRTRSGPFSLEEAITLDELETWTEEDWTNRLLPMDRALTKLPVLKLNDDDIQKLQHGQLINSPKEVAADQLYRVYTTCGQLIALALAMDSKQIKPKKVFET